MFVAAFVFVVSNKSLAFVSQSSTDMLHRSRGSHKLLLPLRLVAVAIAQCIGATAAARNRHAGLRGARAVAVLGVQKVWRAATRATAISTHDPLEHAPLR